MEERSKRVQIEADDVLAELAKINKITGNIPGRPGPGRPKGSPNKTTAAVKDAILQAFDEVGGAALVTVAQVCRLLSYAKVAAAVAEAQSAWIGHENFTKPDTKT